MWLHSSVQFHWAFLHEHLAPQPLSLLQPRILSVHCSLQAAEESGSLHHTGTQDKVSLFNVRPYSSGESACFFCIAGRWYSPNSSLIRYMHVTVSSAVAEHLALDVCFPLFSSFD